MGILTDPMERGSFFPTDSHASRRGVTHAVNEKTRSLRESFGFVSIVPTVIVARIDEKAVGSTLLVTATASRR